MFLAMKIEFTKQAKNDASRLEKSAFKRIKIKLQWYLSHEDPIIFADNLTDPRLGKYRYRIGNYRVIFDFDGEMITVNKIGHRKEIYR